MPQTAARSCASIVRALLPLGEGTILDPFMGSGSAIAAAEAVGYTATGLELDTEYFRLAEHAIPRLASLYPAFKGQAMDAETDGQRGTRRTARPVGARSIGNSPALCGTRIQTKATTRRKPACVKSDVILRTLFGRTIFDAENPAGYCFNNFAGSFFMR